MVVQKILDGDDVEGGKGFNIGVLNGESVNGSGERGFLKVLEKNKGKLKEQEIDWENVFMMFDEFDFVQRYFLDFYKLNYSEFLLELLWLYLFFEGWFVWIMDFMNKFSVVVILVMNYVIDESQVIFLFVFGRNVDKEGDREVVKYGYIYVVRIKMKV